MPSFYSVDRKNAEQKRQSVPNSSIDTANVARMRAFDKDNRHQELAPAADANGTTTRNQFPLTWAVVEHHAVDRPAHQAKPGALKKAVADVEEMCKEAIGNNARCTAILKKKKIVMPRHCQPHGKTNCPFLFL